VVGWRGGGGDFGSDVAGDLDGGAADGSGGSGDQDALPRREFRTVNQELGGGEAAEEEGGALS
jgi:hypothetical protein